MKRAPAPLAATDELNDRIDRYLAILDPLFFPSDPISNDVIRFFASLLRVRGIEDVNSDPFGESRATLEDLNRLMQIDLPDDQFPDRSSTNWRLGLQFYCHIVEMSAPYEVLANLLRFRLGEGYSPNPFHKFLNAKERKRADRYGVSTYDKLAVLKRLGHRAGIALESLIDEFYLPELRNAVTHSDYILQKDRVISREGYPNSVLNLSYESLDKTLSAARAFISAFFGLELESRRSWGACAGRALPYDPHYKGMMEVLADRDGLMNGFKVHWPNGEESWYRRTSDAIDMVNCFFDSNQDTVQCFVGLYARNPGKFSPLVEVGATPIYSPIDQTGIPPVWDEDGARAERKPLRRSEGGPLFGTRVTSDN